MQLTSTSYGPTKYIDCLIPTADLSCHAEKNLLQVQE